MRISVRFFMMIAIHSQIFKCIQALQIKHIMCSNKKSPVCLVLRTTFLWLKSFTMNKICWRRKIIPSKQSCIERAHFVLVGACSCWCLKLNFWSFCCKLYDAHLMMILFNLICCHLGHDERPVKAKNGKRTETEWKMSRVQGAKAALAFKSKRVVE